MVTAAVFGALIMVARRVAALFAHGGSAGGMALPPPPNRSRLRFPAGAHVSRARD